MHVQPVCSVYPPVGLGQELYLKQKKSTSDHDSKAPERAKQADSRAVENGPASGEGRVRLARLPRWAGRRCPARAKGPTGRTAAAYSGSPGVRPARMRQALGPGTTQCEAGEAAAMRARCVPMATEPPGAVGQTVVGEAPGQTHAAV